jgi:hypothetical protein
MKTAIIKNGIVANVIMASKDQAEKVYKDHVCVESDVAGIGWTYDKGVFTPPEPSPEETAKQAEQLQKAQAIEQAKTDIKKEKDAFTSEGKSLSMAYLDKRLTAIETILGV